MAQAQPIASHPAVVARFEGADSHELYLRVEQNGVRWEADSALATAFPSLRDASRAALRLPAAWRAFGVPATPGHLLHAA